MEGKELYKCNVNKLFPQSRIKSDQDLMSLQAEKLLDTWKRKKEKRKERRNERKKERGKMVV